MSHNITKTKTGSKSAVLRMAWPIAISMISYTLKSFIDTLMVGHLGLEALAGVGLAGVLVWTLGSFPFGALRGQRPLVSQYFGAGDHKATLSFAVHAFYFAGCASLVFLLAAEPLATLTRWIGDSSTISEPASIMASDYVRIRMIWMGPMLLSLAIAEYLRSIELPRIPMIADLLAHPLNIVFNYLLIFGHFGFPALGVEGAAIGTGLADLCALIFLIIFARPKGERRLFWISGDAFRFSWTRLKRVLETGYTGGVQFALEGVSFLLITYFVSFLGTASLAIQQAAIQLVHMSILPAVALADGGSVLIGKFVGEKKWEEVSHTVHSVLSIILPFMCIMSLCFITFGEDLIGLFINDSDTSIQANTILIGGSVAWAMALWQVGDAFQITYRRCLRATGDHKWVMWIGILMSWIVNIPVIAITIFYFEGTIFHAWLAFAIEVYLGAWIFHRRWRSGAWKEKRLVNL